jgi:outer membrane protein OmpA-like peptidoglycan-associated protein
VTVGAEPVEAFLDAVNHADLHRAHEMLAPDAELSVPSLRTTLRGREQVTGGLEAVLVAFPDLRYASSSRYVAPGQVTDEVLLTGIRLGPWGQLPPTGRPHRLPARIMLEHDGVSVTRVCVWADLGSLRALVTEDGTAGQSAVPIVSALRATIPAVDPRVIVAAARDTSAAPQQAVRAQPARPTELNSAAAKAAELRVPLPRRVRRLLVASASGLMAAAAIGIVAWVVQGALSAPGGTAVPVVAVRPSSADATSRPAASRASSSRPAKVSATPSPEPAYTQVGNRFTLNTDLTFDVDSAHLNDRARQALMRIMNQVRADKRRGVIRVNGFTDSDGPRGHNLELSRARAEAVASVLRAGLADLEITVRYAGYGEDRPKANNETDKGKAMNRRVEITVPAGH